MGGNSPKGNLTAQKDIDVVKAMNSSFALGGPYSQNTASLSINLKSSFSTYFGNHHSMVTVSL